MTKENLDLIERKLKSKNIKEFDILIRKKTNFENIFLKENIESNREVTSMDYIIRILNRKGSETGMGIIQSSELNPDKLDNIIDECESLSRINKTSNYTFPSKSTYKQVITTEDKILKEPNSTLNDLSEKLMSIIQDQQNVIPTFGRLALITRKNYLRNSSDLDLSSKSTYLFLEYAIKAEENKNLAEFWDVNLYKNISHLDLENRLPHWTTLARDALKARQPKPTTDAVVIFPPKILMHAINPVIGFHSTGQAHHEKVSAYEINKEVALTDITIKDNGVIDECLGSSPWDGEGNPTGETILIENGIFKNRIYDQKYGILENQKSTGNGMRTQDGSIVNYITNVEIEPGKISSEELISNVKNGMFIEKFSWLNPSGLSGSFGTEIRNAYLIKNGEISDPIKGGNISGSVLEMLKNCINISKERKHVQNCYFPTISFKNLTISS